MKVIDLLNKIANGDEVPEKIKYLGIVFSFQHNCMEYISDYGTSLVKNISSKSLNDKIEIIEDTPKEDKKIKKIDISKFPKRNNSLKKTALKLNEIIELLNNSMLLSEKEVANFLDKVNGDK